MLDDTSYYRANSVIEAIITLEPSLESPGHSTRRLLIRGAHGVEGQQPVWILVFEVL